MKKIKANVCAFLALVLVLGMCIGVSAEGEDIRVLLDGQFLNFDQSPVIVNGRTLVPLRVIFESMGATVDWDDAAKTVTATLGDTTIKLTNNENILYKNGEAITLDVPAQIINSRTMVPARAVTESFGARVSWNENYRWVVISTDTLLNTALDAISKADNYVCRGSVPFIYEGNDGTISVSIGCDYKNRLELYANSVNLSGTETTRILIYNEELAYIYESDTGLDRFGVDESLKLSPMFEPGTAFMYNSENEQDVFYIAVAHDGSADNFAIMVSKETGLPRALIIRDAALSEYFDIDAEFNEDYLAEIVLNSSIIADTWNNFAAEYEGTQK